MNRLRRLLGDSGFSARPACPQFAPSGDWGFIASNDGVDIYAAPRISEAAGCHRSTILIVTKDESGDRRAMSYSHAASLASAAFSFNGQETAHERRMLFVIALLAFAAIQFRLQDLVGVME